MKTKALMALLLLSLTASSQSVSSSVINTAGSSFAQGYFVIDWSLGEMSLVNSMTSPNGALILTNGFLQPGAPNPGDNNHGRFTVDEIKILPNPTYNNVEINFSTLEQGTIDVVVYDVAGRRLLIRQVIGNGLKTSEKIDLSRFAAGTYLFWIELNPLPGSVRKTGSYKIVKL